MRAPAVVQRTSYYAIHVSEVVDERVIIAMVGLPARGKSYMSKAIMRYLGFLGVACKLFNAGNKRREQGKAGADAAFFDPTNLSAQAQKEAMAMETLEDVLVWLNHQYSDVTSGGAGRGLACGIFDATNTTVDRRRAVVERCACASPPVTLVFLESVCNDEEILQHNYNMKLFNDDYKGAHAQKALDDFLERVRAYEKVYEPISDAEVDALAAPGRSTAPLPPMRYIQSIDAGKKVTVAQLDGNSFVCKWVVQLVHAIHLSRRKLSIVLAGASLNDHDGIRGGDTALSEEGTEYARAAAALVKQRADVTRPPPCVMLGTLVRYSQMGEMLRDASTHVLPLTALNELCFGSLEGLSAGRLRDTFPEEHAAREKDPLRYRYPGPGGQSYFDLVTQMREVLLSIESSRRDTVIVCDLAIARVLLGYFEALPITQIPHMPVSQGIIELSRTHSGFLRVDVPVHAGRISTLGCRESSVDGIAVGAE